MGAPEKPLEVVVHDLPIQDAHAGQVHPAEEPLPQEVGEAGDGQASLPHRSPGKPLHSPQAGVVALEEAGEAGDEGVEVPPQGGMGRDPSGDPADDDPANLDPSRREGLEGSGVSDPLHPEPTEDERDPGRHRASSSRRRRVGRARRASS